MSNISVQLLSPAATTLAASTNQAIGTGKPLGLPAVIGWGVAGLASLMAFWFAAQVLPALGLQSQWSPVLNLVPLGHIAVVTAMAAALWSVKRPFREYLALKPMSGRDIGRGVLYGVFGYLLLATAFAVLTLVQTALGSEPVTTIPNTEFGYGKLMSLVALWFLMVIAAPVAEEVLFRGFLQRGLTESRLGAFGAITLTSVIFGLVHYPGFGWSRVIATGCVGALLGWLRWRTGNTSLCIMAHAVMNAIGASMLTAIVLLQ